MQRQRRKLTVEDRVVIELRRKDGWGVRAIARELGRSPSVISAELGREPDGNYAAGPAQAAAAARRDRSGRRAKLAPDSPRFAEVANRGASSSAAKIYGSGIHAILTAVIEAPELRPLQERWPYCTPQVAQYPVTFQPRGTVYSTLRTC